MDLRRICRAGFQAGGRGAIGQDIQQKVTIGSQGHARARAVSFSDWAGKRGLAQGVFDRACPLSPAQSGRVGDGKGDWPNGIKLSESADQALSYSQIDRIY